MLGIDLVLLVGVGALLVAAAALIGGKLGARREARQLQGQRNAEQIKQQLEERCAICDAAIDPAHDVWEDGRWWHRGCYRDALK